MTQVFGRVGPSQAGGDARTQVATDPWTLRHDSQEILTGDPEQLAVAGRGDRAPSHEDAEAPLQRMVDAVKGGSHGSFIPFDRSGRPVLFE